MTHFNVPKYSVRIAAATLAMLASATALSACSNSEDTSASTGSTGAAGDTAVTITDVAGREVTFDKQPERIVLGEGRGVFATSILNREDPLEHVVALGKDLHEAAPSFESKFAETNAAYKDLPTIGNIAKGDVTVENLLAQKPDVVVMTLDHKKGAEKTGFLDKMDQAGLKYVFTDFRQKPLENTPKSMEVFGQLLGQEDKAAEFNKFYTGKVDDIKSRAEKAGNKPRTLVWRAAGLKDCCSTVKDSNLGDLVNAAGGENLGDSLLDTESGDLTAEKVLAEQPEHIIATGGAWAKNPEKPEVLPHVEMGYAAKEEKAQETLEGLLKTPGFDQLEAPKEGNFHAVYHQFYDSPFNVFALEQFAVWMHPETFKDLDPEKDFADFHDKWLPIDYSGVFFTTKDAHKH
ncbi:TPA: ABC transporter substrate-binding protein [Corynebacterium striatum]|nr:ABC transporter substrate-binding protein [Corynebacterium striatum]